MIDDRLRCFDHHFKLQTSSGESCLLLELTEQCGERRHLFGNRDLWQRYDEVIRQTSVVAFDKRGDKDVERAKAARAQFFIERLDSNADERRQRAILTSFSSLGCRGNSVSILFVVGTVSITIFKIDAEVFDGFALKFLARLCCKSCGPAMLLFSLCARDRVRSSETRRVRSLRQTFPAARLSQAN